ncbi:UPF0489 family protein [Patescibacteria group bacterium]|nr:UPF0489 family protein [Patescibacteria group bacterium]MCL5798406.1 UPF0489 family protein [Patescibacteria group bacterium]
MALDHITTDLPQTDFSTRKLLPVELKMPIPGNYDGNGISSYLHTQSFHPFADGFKVPLLRLGSYRDLKLANNYYKGNVDPQYWGFSEYIRDEIGPKKIPAYFFDHHNMALFGWAEALTEGKIQKGATLIHFDAHDDCGKSDIRINNIYDLKEVAYKAKQLKYTQFIDAGLKSGIIGKVIYVDPDIADAEHEDFPGNEYDVPYTRIGINSPLLKKLLNRGDSNLITDWDVDFFTDLVDAQWREIKHGKEFESSEGKLRLDITIREQMDTIAQTMAKSGVITVATSPPKIYQVPPFTPQNPDQRTGILDQSIALNLIMQMFRKLGN